MSARQPTNSINDKEMLWPENYDFGDLICQSNKKTGTLDAGTWRIVVPVSVDGRNKTCVAKVLREMPAINRPIKLAVSLFRRLFAIDENSREWRFLIKHGRSNELAKLLPEPIARGRVNGAPAILVEQISLQSEAINLFNFAEKASQAQKAQITKCLDEITELFGRYHVVCNDISDRNIMVSDRTGELSLVVIDGFGNNHLIPYPIFSKTLNARKIARRLNRTKERLGLNEMGN